MMARKSRIEEGNYLESKTALVECFKFGIIIETIY